MKIALFYEKEDNALSTSAVELKRELSTLGQVINIELLDQWEVKVKEHLQDIQTEIEALNNAAPQNKEEQHENFVLKKEILEEDSNRRFQKKNDKISF